MPLRPSLCQLVCCLLAVCGLFIWDGASYAGGTYQPPRNGLETPDTPRYRPPPEVRAYTNAYGNLVYPDEPSKPQSERLPSGAYGAKPKAASERPLPKVPDNRPAW